MSLGPETLVNTEKDAVLEQVIQLARQIEQLCRSETPPEQMFPAFLQALGRAVGAEAAVIWMLDENRQLVIKSEFGLGRVGLSDAPAALTLNQRLVIQALSTGQTTLVHPDRPGDLELPVPKTIILSPLKLEADCVGVVQVFQKTETPPQARQGFLQFVEKMTALASQYLVKQHSAVVKPDMMQAGDPAGITELSKFVYALQRGKKLKEVAAVAASDGRLFLDVDRVSVIVQRGRKFEVTAVSGQQKVNKRANLVRRMRDLGQTVIRSGEPLLFNGEDQELAPDVQKKLAEFLEESRARFLALVPLKQPPELTPYHDGDEQQEDKQMKTDLPTFGCLVVEHMSRGELTPQLENRIDLVTGHVAAGLTTAREQEQIVLLPIWRSIGRFRDSLNGRKLLKYTFIFAVIAAIITSLVLVPWDYRVTGQGRLMPVTQRSVFAPYEGDVIEVSVKGGQRVVAGQQLLKLRNDELEQEWTGLQNQINEKKQMLTTLSGQIATLTRPEDRAEVNRLRGQVLESRMEIFDLEQRREVLKRRREQLVIVSPIDGVVATFQLDQKLRGRPVSRGEVLLDVMDDKGDWHLELDVADNRLGHLLGGQDKLETQALPVDYVLATRPEDTLTGELKSLSIRAEVSQEEGLVVPVLVQINPKTLTDHDRRIGAEVKAKISCGERSLGYCLFGDVIEFFQKQFWL